jgi:hypothetical protein
VEGENALYADNMKHSGAAAEQAKRMMNNSNADRLEEQLLNLTVGKQDVPQGDAQLRSRSVLKLESGPLVSYLGLLG